MAALAGAYAAGFRIAVAVLVQYRMANLLWLTAMVVEPVVYLVVWQTVAEAQGGSVAGFDAGDFVSYYIIWTLVRQMNIALTPWAFEERIQRGTLSPELLLPIHPFHRDMAWFAGFKAVTLALWLPVGAGLWLIFRPPLSPSIEHVVGFALCMTTAYIMRFVLLWALGMATFWITRVSAFFDLYFAAELLLSGRLVPMALMPEPVQRLAAFLPFQWSFGFPIEVLMGRVSRGEFVLGLVAQYIWFLIGLAALRVLWRSGLRRYSAVGA